MGLFKGYYVGMQRRSNLYELEDDFDSHGTHTNPHLTAYNDLQGSKPPNNATHNSSDSYLLDLGNHTGMLPISQVSGLEEMARGLKYKGGWDASTGYPSGEEGDYWICSAAGEAGGVSFKPKDWIVWNPTNSVWDKIDNTDSVKTVNGVEPDASGNIAIDAGGGSLTSEVVDLFEAGETRQISLNLPILGMVETIYSLEEV